MGGYGPSVAGRSGQLCLHWPYMFCRLGGRPLLDANCPFATTIISTLNRAGAARSNLVEHRPRRGPWTYPRVWAYNAEGDGDV